MGLLAKAEVEAPNHYIWQPHKCQTHRECWNVAGPPLLCVSKCQRVAVVLSTYLFIYLHSFCTLAPPNSSHRWKSFIAGAEF